MRFTSIAVVLGQGMSSCLSTLDPVAKTIYFAKIQQFGLTASEDPYEIWKKGKLEKDMTLCPPVEYDHVFCCFVEWPGTVARKQLLQWKSMEDFARKQLLQWKSMEVSNYFQSGRVRDMKVYTVLATHSCVDCPDGFC